MNGAQVFDATLKNPEKLVRKIDDLCSFNLVKNNPVSHTSLHQFEANVSYVLLAWNEEQDLARKMDHIYTGGIFGDPQKHHIWIPAPMPEFSYSEFPGQTTGIVPAYDPAQLTEINEKTRVFVHRTLLKTKAFRDTIDVEVNLSEVTRYPEPVLLPFCISERFNSAVGRLNYVVKGYGSDSCKS